MTQFSETHGRRDLRRRRRQARSARLLRRRRHQRRRGARRASSAARRATRCPFRHGLVRASARTPRGTSSASGRPIRRVDAGRIDTIRARAAERAAAPGRSPLRTLGAIEPVPTTPKGTAMPVLPAPRRCSAQATHRLPRERAAPDRGGHGPRGLHRERVDPLPPRVALPREGARGVHADRARGVDSRDARAPAPEHVRRRSARATRSPAAARSCGTTTSRSRSAARLDDGLLLPQRRGRRGDLRPRGIAGRSRRSSATSRTRTATTSSSRAARRTASCPTASSATSCSRRRA